MQNKQLLVDLSPEQSALVEGGYTLHLHSPHRDAVMGTLCFAHPTFWRSSTIRTKNGL
ncbi:MAG TPA: hypothetical protein ACFE0H_03295 [Elainellaceae cyanobacterium]